MIAFGPFTFDSDTGDLRRDGRPIKLHPQPAQLLNLLVNRPGEIVTREEIQRQLWPDDTVVDFDLGINSCIRQIRAALEDTADTPRFIETVPKLGYRFIGEVVAPRKSKGRLWRWVAAVFVFGAVATAGWFLTPDRSKPPPSPPIPLTSFEGEETHPVLSPHGNQVAFVWSRDGEAPFHLYITLIEGGEALQLTRGDANDRHPAWSPDGARIAFLRETEDGSEVRTIPALGGTERVLTTTRRPPAGLDWSPDGRWIAFSDQASSDEPPSIFLVSTESGERRKLTSPPKGEGRSDAQPVFSPDGQSVAFIRQRRASGGGGSVFVQAIDRGSARPVSSPLSFVWDLDWTADGKSLVVSSGKTFASSTLTRVPVSGGQPERLSVGDRARYLSISRSEERLVYSQWLQDHNIWRGPGPTSDGTSSPGPFIVSTRDDTVSRYSPDGTRIAFVSDRSGTWEVWTCDADGANPGRLTDLGHAIRPSWSPDSRQIIFSSVVEGTSDVYTIDASGGFPKNLTADITDTRSALPSWSKDGSWFYYQSDQGGRAGVPWQVWKRSLAGGEPIRITRDGGMGPQESDDGRLFFLRGGKIWSTSTEGGDAVLVLDRRVRFSTWCLWRDSILYINEDTSRIERFHRPTGATTELLNLEPFPRPQMAGLAVSPDGQWLLYTRLDAHGSDLMRVENFH